MPRSEELPAEVFHEYVPRMLGVPERDESFLVAVEARRNLLENLIWGVPGLAVASQAFLFTVTLAAATPSVGRLLAAVAGFVAALATIHYMLKNLYHFDLYEAVIDNERRRLGLPLVHRHELTRAEFSHDSLFQRRWQTPEGWRRRVSRHLLVQRSAVHVWVGTLGVFALIDLVILVFAILEVVGVSTPLER